MRKRVEKSSTILALLDGYHELHLDRSAWVITVLHLIFFSGFMFMKSSIVYAVALRKLIL